jgi:hypothetical protein
VKHRGALAAALLVALGCRRAPDASDTSPPPSSAAAPSATAAASTPLTTPSSVTSPAGKAMKSYVTAYASPARGSRVRTAARPLASLARVAATAGAPVSVVVSPGVDHVAAAYATGLDVWTTQGASTYRTSQGSGKLLTMLDRSFVANGSAMEWDGRSIPVTLREGNIQWALEVGDVWTSAVLMLTPTQVPLSVPLDDGGVARVWDTLGARVRVVSERFFQPERLTTALVWIDELEGAGCGAIADDRRIAVAMHKGRFIVFDGNQATPDLNGVRLADVPIAFAAYDLSVVEGGYAAISVGTLMPDGSPAVTPLGATLAKAARRVELLASAPPRWRTVVHFLDAQGRVAAQTEVPFEVLEPPIDGGGGRVYALGNGVAAFDKGRLLYAHPSPIPMLATAFEDGSLALAIGHELRILTRDGAVKQSFFTAEHEAITAPPAIASDGSVWVGTERAIYVAR